MTKDDYHGEYKPIGNSKASDRSLASIWGVERLAFVVVKATCLAQSGIW